MKSRLMLTGPKTFFNEEEMQAFIIKTFSEDLIKEITTPGTIIFDSSEETNKPKCPHIPEAITLTEFIQQLQDIKSVVYPRKAHVYIHNEKGKHIVVNDFYIDLDHDICLLTDDKRPIDCKRELCGNFNKCKENSK